MLKPAACQQIIFPKKINQYPVLSIAIPTYKRFDLLKETLASVFSLQFSISFEVIVVDNDPQQRDLAIAEMSMFEMEDFSYYKNDENLGMFGNWNQCLAIAKGKYITLLHDDDVLLPEFAQQMNILLKNGSLEHEISSFSVELWDLRANRPVSKGWWLNALKKLLMRFRSADRFEQKSVPDLFFCNPFCGTLGIVMNRGLALSLQGFDKSWYPISDYEFWCRWVCQIGVIPFIRKPIGRYRIQQNESLRLDVRQGFVTKSTELRRRMILQGDLPRWLASTIGVVAWVQEKSISLDWRTESERNPILFRWVGFRVWQKIVSCLCFFLRRVQMARRIS